MDRLGVDGVSRALEAAGAAPTLMVIEITEHGDAGGTTRLVQAVTCIRTCGVRFALDDFGEVPLKGVCAGLPFPLVLMSVAGVGVPSFPSTGASEVAQRLAAIRARMCAQGVRTAPPVFAPPPDD